MKSSEKLAKGPTTDTILVFVVVLSFPLCVFMVAWGAGGPLFVGECLGLGLIRASWVSGLGGDFLLFH